jgi:hypothetical protein
MRFFIVAPNRLYISLFINHFSALMPRARRASRPRREICHFAPKPFTQTQKIYQKVMMLTFEALAPFEENAGSLVATVALKKTRASLTLLGMTSLVGQIQWVPGSPCRRIEYPNGQGMEAGYVRLDTIVASMAEEEK